MRRTFRSRVPPQLLLGPRPSAAGKREGAQDCENGVVEDIVQELNLSPDLPV